MPSSAASSADSGPLYESDPVPSPEPVRPAVLDSVSVPSETESVRLPNRVERPGIGILDRDAVARLRSRKPEIGWPPRERTADGACRVARRRDETSEVLPWGSVAVAVMIGSPAGAVKGTAKLTCPVASVVTSSEPR